MQAVVTGSASGMGAACVSSLRQAGFDVHEWDVNGSLGVDVGSSASVAEATARLTAPLDVAVLAAGIFRSSPLIRTTDDDWFDQLRVNAFGVFNSIRSLVPLMVNGGSIVIISSVGGLRGAPNESAYSASKFAVTGLMEAAAPELANLGIRINCVSPMFIRTPMTDAGYARREGLTGVTVAEAYRAAAAKVPLGRVAEVDDVADAVLYLATDASRYVTGTSLIVSGGAHLGFLAPKD